MPRMVQVIVSIAAVAKASLKISWQL